MIFPFRDDAADVADDAVAGVFVPAPLIPKPLTVAPLFPGARAAPFPHLFVQFAARRPRDHNGPFVFVLTRCVCLLLATFPGRDAIFWVYLSTLMCRAVTLIPLFFIMKDFGWIDSYQD